MNVLLRKYYWFINLVVIAICAYFMASILINTLLVARLPVPKQKARRTARAVTPAGPRLVDVSAILSRNIFCHKCEAAQEIATDDSTPKTAAGDGTPGDPSSAVKSSLNHKLLATLVSEQDRAWSFAALLDPEENRTRMYAIGKKLHGSEATVVDILTRRILISRNNRTEYIELDRGGARTSTAARPHLNRPQTKKRSSFNRFTSDIAAGVRKIGPNKWEIRRSALNKVLGNTTMLARSARIVPSVRNGKPNGFKLYAIRPGSVYSLIGMQNGDTLHAINGHAITTPDKALAVYTQVRTASHLTISFSRRGQAKTHDYTIR